MKSWRWHSTEFLQNIRSEFMFYSFSKRLFDVVFAGFGLLVLLPLGLVLALLVKVSDGGPVFYTQIRIGRHGRPFPIRKFRSMVVNADKVGLAVTSDGDPRITWIGRLLRKSKLDELPQLWNVLVGQMSFVGPRPEVPRYVERYTPEQREILRYKPGITDMATLQFRNEEALLSGCADVETFYLQTCLPKKIALNLQYQERASLLQDVWIIVQTLCPYWLGVLSVYGMVLSASFWMSCLLKYDFQLAAVLTQKIWLQWPVMVLPQLVLLVWKGDVRGLMSYFSIRELRQTSAALVGAALIQFVLGSVSNGRLGPSASLVVIHFMVSLLALGAIRMGVRFLRERASRDRNRPPMKISRVGVVGTGPVATNLALDLARSLEASRQVVAFFDDDPRSWHKRPHGIPIVGMPECILHQEWRSALDEIVVALPEASAVRAREIGSLLRESGIRVSYVSAWPVLQPQAGAGVVASLR